MKSKLPSSVNPGKGRGVIGLLLAVVLLGGVVSFLRSPGKIHTRETKRQEFISVTLPPPPPPKVEPPPPKEEPPKDEEIVEEKPIDLEEPPPEAPEAPSPDLGTNITGGNGPDMGLTRGGGNGRVGGRPGGSGKGSPYNRYALGAKATIEEALRRDPVTRRAIINGLKLEFWPDAEGIITRAKIIGGGGDSSLDQAVLRVLKGLRTQAAASPAEMPPSVKIRINARKPSI